MGLRWIRARSTHTKEEPGQWLVVAAPAGAAVRAHKEAAEADGSGDNGCGAATGGSRLSWGRRMK